MSGDGLSQSQLRPDSGDRSDEKAAAMLVCADHARDGDELIEFLRMLGLIQPEA